jgi:hypothetical protein
MKKDHADNGAAAERIDLPIPFHFKASFQKNPAKETSRPGMIAYVVPFYSD